MLGRVTEGLHAGCVLDRIGEKGAMFILLEDGQKVFLQRNTIEKISSLVGPGGEKMVQVDWKNGMSSRIRLGADPEPAAPVAEEPAVQEPAAPAYEPTVPVYEPAAPAYEPAEAPAYQTAPLYEQEQEYRTAPLYEQAEPVCQEAPAGYQENPPAYEPAAPGFMPEEPAYQAAYAPAAVPVAAPVAPVFNLKLLKILLIALGVVALVLAVSVYGMDTGYYESSRTYGGDAYTGIQNAAAQTANNVQDLAEIVQTGFAGVLAVMGGTLITGGVCINTKKKK